MNFVNEYTISDMINTAILLITFIGILLTFFTLLEMKRQRKISIMPRIIISLDDESEFGFFIPKKVSVEDKYNYSLRLKLKNVGNGAANLINLNYVIDNNLIDSRWCDIDNNLIFINTHRKTVEVFSLENDNNIVYPSISANEEVVIDTNDIMQIIYMMLSIYMKHDKNKLYSAKKIIDINMKYFDILGNEYKRKFSIHIKEITEGCADRESGYFIKCTILQ